MDELLELIKNGADLNFSTPEGKTLLMSASMKNDIEILKLLIKHTDRIDTQDKEQHTALYYATKVNNIKAVEVLVQSGANISDDIYMIAIHNDFKEVTKIFDLQDKDKVYLSKTFS